MTAIRLERKIKSSSFEGRSKLESRFKSELDSKLESRLESELESKLDDVRPMLQVV